MMFNVNFIAPHPILKKYVKNLWYRYPNISNREYSTYKLLADGAPGLIFHHNNGESAISEQNGAALPVAFVYGQATKPCYNLERGNSFVFGINFQPTAIKTLFGIDANDATDTIIGLDDIAGYSITEKMLNAPDPESLVYLFTDFLWRRLRENGKEDVVIDRSLSHISQNIEWVTASDLARCFGVSQRQFQRRFKQFVGINLTTYIRIIKFQQALKSIRNNRHCKLSDIAYQLGYADQSHFTREFKFFADEKPKDVLKLNRICADTRNDYPNLYFATNRIVLC